LPEPCFKGRLVKRAGEGPGLDLVEAHPAGRRLTTLRRLGRMRDSATMQRNDAADRPRERDRRARLSMRPIDRWFSRRRAAEQTRRASVRSARVRRVPIKAARGCACERERVHAVVLRNGQKRMRFEGTSAYVATDDLKVAVNAAIALERPLLVKGEPGTGKTVLAVEIANAINAPLIEWHIKSTTKAQQGLYEYDAVTRLRDSQLGDARVRDIRNYIKRGKLWDAFTAGERPVLLIDEIDKADIEFPNDLLQELDRMEFFVYETGETVRARRRPIVVVTSNNEKELPDAFLRRCFFHYIRFPDPDTMRAIVEVHFPGIKQRLVAEALKLFYEIRDVPGVKKKPSTSELLDWLKLLMVEDISAETLRERDPKRLIPPLHGALIKNEQDVHLFERLAFMARRERQ
jgi:MoxR-like ATPase